MKNLEELLNDTDFSQDSRNKEAIKARLLGKYAKGEISMKRFRFKPVYVAAAAVFAVGITMAACGEDIIKIVQQFTVGKHATFVTYDDDTNTRSTVQGDIFTDEEIAAARLTGQDLIREMDDGSVIAVRFNDDVFSYEKEIEREKSTATYGGAVTYFDTVDDVKPYLAFNPLMPVSLPTGFALDRISLFNDENGGPLPLGSGMYLNVYYTNAGKTQQIYMQLRMMNEESGFTASGSPDMRYITINGHKGVVAVKSVHVEIDGVMYMILADYSGDGVTQQDVIKMAESLR
jgi:hypothetical protein